MRPRPLLAVLVVLTLAACAAPRVDFDPHERFQNRAEKHSATATITRRTPEAPLGPGDRAVLVDLAREQVRRGAGAVAVSVRHGGDEVEAHAFADAVAATLDEAGAGAVSVTFAARPDLAAPVAEIAVPVWVAVVPECGTWTEGIGTDYRNQNSANFGCAVTRNMGLMVANPADLVRARDASGRSGARSSDVLTKYGEGKATASKAEESKPTVTLSTVGTK